jgi:DNA polymerase-1
MTAAKASETASASIYLIDAHSLIFQVFHAISEMSSPTGVPTNALFGFARDVLFLKEEKRPDYLLCAFDAPGDTFRHAFYPEYKANRGPMPDDLVPQIPEIHRLLEALRVPVVSQVGIEADDLIATVAKAASARGMRVFICTSDKDCRQLLDERTRLYSLRKHQAFGPDELQADWGVTPEQVIDFQTLVGDAVDNVPGVPGIGEKTAAKLLQEFGTVENILANIDRISGKKRQENLQAFAGKVELTRNLVRLKTDVAIPLDWEAWKLQPPDVPKFTALCREWGFRRLAEQVAAGARNESPPATSAQSTFIQGELFPFGANDDAEPTPARTSGPLTAAAPVQRAKDDWQATYRLVDTSEKYREFERQLRQQKRFAVDLETTSLEPRRADIVGLAFSWQAGEGWYLAVRGPDNDAKLDPHETLAKLRSVLEDPTVAKINQNIKYDWLVFRQHGVNLAGVVGDPMVADYLLHAGERSHSLEDLSNRYLQHRVIPITDLIGKKAKTQLRMDQVPTVQVAEYAGEDADVAFRLDEILEKELSEQKLKQLYDEIEIPLIAVLAELEFNGIRLDVPLLRKLGGEMASQLAEIAQAIYEIAGHEFNIDSPKQLRKILFEEMKLPVQRKTGVTGEPSTDQETLEKLAAMGHPLPRKIVEYRQVSKLKGTYVDALPEMVNPATGRVHASFNQTVAATGRLSSSEPNLQNVPVRTAQGRQIRQAFVPEPGWLLLTADYSQIELRLLAHFSGDEQMRSAFAKDQDIHAAVAAQIFSIPEAEVTADQRRMAKTVNFGVIYGMSAHGLAERLEISRDEAGKFIDAYFARYPKVLGYQAQLLERCRKTGFVTTILGRRRAITGIRADSSYQQRNQPEREAINMEIQGSAADLMKLAMLNIYRRLRLSKLQCRMLLTVHDELVFESPPDELKAAAKLVEEEMTGAMKLDVPLKVDVGAGPNWLDVGDV